MTLKQTIYILTIALGLLSCNNQPKQVDDKTIANIDTTLNGNSVRSSNDTSKNNGQQKDGTLISSEKHPNLNSKENREFKDSVIRFSDSHFYNLELKFKAISSSNYKDYKEKHKIICSIDSNGFIEGKRLILSNYCHDICELYLTDKKEGVKLVLPSSTDEGIIGLEISPSCTQFIVYSSRDITDMHYCDGCPRAEVFGFTIEQGQGYKTIKPSFKLYTTSYSIAEVIWVDDNSIAIKIYEESRNTDTEDKLKYKYYITTITK